MRLKLRLNKVLVFTTLLVYIFCWILTVIKSESLVRHLAENAKEEVDSIERLWDSTFNGKNPKGHQVNPHKTDGDNPEKNNGDDPEKKDGGNLEQSADVKENLEEEGEAPPTLAEGEEEGSQEEAAEDSKEQNEEEGEEENNEEEGEEENNEEQGSKENNEEQGSKENEEEGGDENEEEGGEDEEPSSGSNEQEDVETSTEKAPTTTEKALTTTEKAPTHTKKVKTPTPTKKVETPITTTPVPVKVEGQTQSKKVKKKVESTTTEVPTTKPTTEKPKVEPTTKKVEQVTPSPNPVTSKPQQKNQGSVKGQKSKDKNKPKHKKAKFSSEEGEEGLSAPISQIINKGIDELQSHLPQSLQEGQAEPLGFLVHKKKKFSGESGSEEKESTQIKDESHGSQDKSSNALKGESENGGSKQENVGADLDNKGLFDINKKTDAIFSVIKSTFKFGTTTPEKHENTTSSLQLVNGTLNGLPTETNISSAVNALTPTTNSSLANTNVLAPPAGSLTPTANVTTNALTPPPNVVIPTTNSTVTPTNNTGISISNFLLPSTNSMTPAENALNAAANILTHPVGDTKVLQQHAKDILEKSDDYMPRLTTYNQDPADKDVPKDKKHQDKDDQHINAVVPQALPTVSELGGDEVEVAVAAPVVSSPTQLVEPDKEQDTVILTANIPVPKGMVDNSTSTSEPLVEEKTEHKRKKSRKKVTHSEPENIFNSNPLSRSTSHSGAQTNSSNDTDSPPVSNSENSHNSEESEKAAQRLKNSQIADEYFKASRHSAEHMTSALLAQANKRPSSTTTTKSPLRLQKGQNSDKNPANKKGKSGTKKPSLSSKQGNGNRLNSKNNSTKQETRKKTQNKKAIKESGKYVAIGAPLKEDELEEDTPLTASPTTTIKPPTIVKSKKDGTSAKSSGTKKKATPNKNKNSKNSTSSASKKHSEENSHTTTTKPKKKPSPMKLPNVPKLQTLTSSINPEKQLIKPTKKPAKKIATTKKLKAIKKAKGKSIVSTSNMKDPLAVMGDELTPPKVPKSGNFLKPKFFNRHSNGENGGVANNVPAPNNLPQNLPQNPPNFGQNPTINNNSPYGNGPQMTNPSGPYPNPNPAFNSQPYISTQGQQPAYNNQPYNNQLYSNQPYNNQPYINQPYNNQPYNNQPYQNVPYNNQPYNNNPSYNNPPQNNQPYSNPINPNYNPSNYNYNPAQITGNLDNSARTGDDHNKHHHFQMNLK